MQNRPSTLVILFASTLVRAEPLTLAGERWSIEIDPPTLGVRAMTRDRDSITLATPLEADRRATAPARVGDAWAWTTHGLAVTVRLENDAVVIDLVASEPGTFTWPTVPGDARSLVVPMFEGLCIPTDDAEWATFLKDHGPLNTTGDLSMPFFATLSDRHSVTYTLRNAFNNEVSFAAKDGRLGLSLTHAFTRNHAVKTYGVRIELGDPSPIAPAKRYRQSLIDAGTFVTMKEKIAKTPDAAKLLGAAHVYLWGDETIAVEDGKDFGKLSARITPLGAERFGFDGEQSPRERVWSCISQEARKIFPGVQEESTHYTKRLFVAALNEALDRREFHSPDAWKDVPIDESLRKEIAAGVADDRIRIVNARLLYAAFPDCFAPIDAWGNGFSTPMIDMFVDAKLDRLWLGSPNFAGLADHPQFVQKAKDAGYLVGPYDSYHSIHAPGQADTWETAQFDQALFDTGGVVLADGKIKKGFKQRGAILSPRAARPAVEERVNRLAKQFGCNSWFIDCDATGENFDDYSPVHPATQAQDQAERLSRMAWIRDAHGMVIGSEGGSAYAAPVIHFAHGMMTPVIGWGDEGMTKDKASPFFLGAYYPPDAPATFFKRVPMKPELAKFYADPRYRVPLYQIVFHDSVIATHQWGFGSLKFDDPKHARALLELLYNVPPLYHLNRTEWPKQKVEITKHYAFFSPIHRETALLPMGSFEWLSADRLVQRTTFGDRWELVANFSAQPFDHGTFAVPAQAILARDRQSGRVTVFQP